MPDQELEALAASGDLANKEIILAQLERMLADPKSERFISDFAGQWLHLHDIDDTAPDNTLYPEYFCDALVVDSAVAETHATLRKMVTENLPVSTVVDSDFLMINERLAEVYGIEGVQGNEIRPIEVPKDSPRGGILTQSSIMKVTANGLTTSPVVRGTWILETILGNHPPPPPPGVGSIDPDTRGTTTVREQLAKHSTDPSCASCHKYIDPPGFALENFDVMGAWRDNYRSLSDGERVDKTVALRKVDYKIGPEVDASGKTVDGAEFEDIRGFREYLLGEQEQIARNLTERLMTFATGAGVNFADRPIVEGILRDTEDSDYGIRSILQEIVCSEIFLSK